MIVGRGLEAWRADREEMGGGGASGVEIVEPAGTGNGTMDCPGPPRCIVHAGPVATCPLSRYPQ
jgi:hypothetical protein